MPENTPDNPPPSPKEKASAALKPKNGQQKESPPKPEDEGVRKGKRVPMIVLTILFLAAGVGGLLYDLHARNFEKSDDAFIEGHVSTVSPKVAARVLTVRFNEQVLQAQAQADQADAQLAQAEAQTGQQQAQFDVAAINFNRNSSLYQHDLRAIAKQEVDTTSSNKDAARAALAAAQANVKAMRAGGEAARATLESSKANVRNARAVVHDAEFQLSYTKIYAPEAGRITRKQVEPGDYLQTAPAICSLVQPDVWITANYKETQLRQMREGQSAEIKVDAYPDRRLKAHVESVQPGTGSRFSLLPAENATGNYVKVVQRVPVKLVFDESPDTLRLLSPGLSVEPTVDLRSGGQEKRK